MLHPVVEQVTAALEQRSARRRERYVQRLAIAAERDPHKAMGCSNLAHAMAAQPEDARHGVIPPFLTGGIRRTYAAIFSFCAGVMPPMPMFGRSLL